MIVIDKENFRNLVTIKCATVSEVLRLIDQVPTFEYKEESKCRE